MRTTRGRNWHQLNAVAAAGELLPDGSFEFVGVNKGAIDPKVAATYVFGIDRNGKLPTGPFDKRPDIRFDALIEVSVKPGQATTATVISGQPYDHELAARLVLSRGSRDRGDRPGEPTPLDGPPPLAVPVQLLA